MRKYTKEDYEEVVRLRNLGYGYLKISRMTGFNKNTISGWIYRGIKPYLAWTKEEKNTQYRESWNRGQTAKTDPRILSGKNHYWFGKKLSKEHREKLSIAAKTPRRLKIFLENRFSDSIKGKEHPNYGRKHSKETKQKIREARKKQRFPKNKTRPELKLLEIIDKYDLPIKYVGDGSYWIENINPDFISLNGKLAIEVFGSYWHDPNQRPNILLVQTESGRREYLKKLGWDLIVIWEFDFKGGEKFVLSKLKHPLLETTNLEYIQTFRELG